MATAPLNLREFANQLRLDGPLYSAQFADEIHQMLDEAEIVAAIAYELDDPDDLANECRRLVTLETRLMTALEEWGAIDPNDPRPPDPINVLRLLLG